MLRRERRKPRLFRSFGLLIDRGFGDLSQCLVGRLFLLESLLQEWHGLLEAEFPSRSALA